MIHALYYFWGKGKTLIRECPTCDEKRGEGKEEIDRRPSDEKWMRKPVFVLSSNKRSEI